MIEKLQTKQNRKYFFVIVGLLLITVFLIRYLLVPFAIGEPITFDVGVLYNILDKIFISVLVTVGLGTFLFWLNPRNKSNAKIRILQPIEIGETITEARMNTEKWWFNGGSGRYTRSETLPYLANLARTKNRHIDIVIQIMDPKNEELCLNYANYRNSLRSAKNGKRTLKSVQMELLATIVSCYMWKSEQALLQITLGLKKNFSLFRTDLSSSKALITKEDPMEPAILYENGSFFYTAQVEEINQVKNQTRTLDITVPFVEKGQINIENTKQLLKAIELGDILSDDELKSVVKLVKNSKNPYA